MRLWCTAALALAIAGCDPGAAPNPPPTGAFYFPTGIVHVDVPGSTEGVLYVASSNFDKRFDFGAVHAVVLGSVSGDGGTLPALGEAVGGPVRNLPDLGLDGSSTVFVQSFAGEMEAFPLDDGGYRLFVPSRAEGHRLHVIEAAAGALSCYFPPAGGGNNCIEGAPSATAYEKSLPDGSPNETGLPRAPEPYGVGLSPKAACRTGADCGGAVCAPNGFCASGPGELFLTHLRSADSPPGTLENRRAYLATMSTELPAFDLTSFVEMGEGAASSVAVGRRYAYVTGRVGAPLLRLVDRTTRDVLNPGLESRFRMSEARGIALSPDERRLYLVGRSTIDNTTTLDVLLVVDIERPDSALPVFKVLQGVPLPEGANQVRVIPRASAGNVVAVSCTGANLLALYDDDLGALTAQVTGVGLQPYGLAVDHRGDAARIYVSSFGDGTVAVVDVPSLASPHRAFVVAHLGARQTCLVQPKDASCQGVAR